MRELLIEQFKLVFPRVIDRMCGGETLSETLKEFPIAIERGAFMRWVNKDAERRSIFTDAKRVRSEIWAGEMIRHALAEDPSLANTELDRSRFIVDTYKFLISRENKHEFGDTKQIEFTGNISITAALQAAGSRVSQITEFSDDEEQEVKRIAAPVEVEWEDDDNG